MDRQGASSLLLEGGSMERQGPCGEAPSIDRQGACGLSGTMDRQDPCAAIDHLDGNRIDSLINRYNPYRARGIDEAACQQMRQSLANINASLEGCEALGGKGGHGGLGGGFGGLGSSDTPETQKGKNEARGIVGQFGQLGLGYSPGDGQPSTASSDVFASPVVGEGKEGYGADEDMEMEDASEINKAIGAGKVMDRTGK